MKDLIKASALLFIFAVSVLAQRELGVRPTNTGGPLVFEQAAFDVQSYDVTINADPKTKSIAGTTVMTARTVIPTNVILLDLDTPYMISKLTDGDGRELKYERTPTQIRIFFPMTKQVGDEIKTAITYAGVPRDAPRPPWIGGFIWTKTPSGADWISVALQNDGADLMFPSKTTRPTNPRWRRCISRFPSRWSRQARANSRV